MLILLPPSEGKAPPRPRGRPAQPHTWSFAQLNPTRARVGQALAQASTGPQAPARLGVSPRLAAELAANTRQQELNAIPVEQLYTGTLYAALDIGAMESSARRRARSWVVVFSALHGVLRLGDRIAPYRLAIGTTVPGLPGLASLWRPELAGPLTSAAGRGLICDARSGGYAAMWTPPPELSRGWVRIVVPGVSHLAKKTRGQVARALCTSAARTPQRPEEVTAIVRAELGDSHQVELRAPESPRAPWQLAVSPH